MSASGLKLGAVDTELPTPAALADGAANPTAPTVGAAGLTWNGTTWDRARGAGGLGDGLGGNGLGVAAAAAYNGATWDRRRTPNIFGLATASAAGNNALLTPAAGKKFRLMKFMFLVTGNASAAAAGLVNLSLADGASSILGPFQVFLPNASPNVNGWLVVSPWFDLGNGVLSAAANNVLNASLSAALVTGSFAVAFAVTEE